MNVISSQGNALTREFCHALAVPFFSLLISAPWQCCRLRCRTLGRRRHFGGMTDFACARSPTAQTGPWPAHSLISLCFDKLRPLLRCGDCGQSRCLERVSSACQIREAELLCQYKVVLAKNCVPAPAWHRECSAPLKASSIFSCLTGVGRRKRLTRPASSRSAERCISTR
jgi:hypothetical protein